MSALSGKQIRDRLNLGDLKRRLVVSPLLEPDEQLRSAQASIDVRLGFEFALVAPSSYGAIDEFDRGQDNKIQDLNLTPLYTKKYVPFGGVIVIHPHQLILSITLEYLRLPYDLMAYVVGRSTWGRLGLIVATAMGIHPGFAGPLTLELRNLGETPLRLYPGQPIAQLFLHPVQAPDDPVDEVGQYSGVTDVVPKKISPNKTRDKIDALNQRLKK